MKSRHHGVHFKFIATIATAVFFLNSMNVSAEEEDDPAEVITYPYVVNNENKHENSSRS